MIDSREAHPMRSGETPSLWTFYQMATTRANTSRWGHTLESRITTASMEPYPLPNTFLFCLIAFVPS